jgi:putative glycosyltransferase
MKLSIVATLYQSAPYIREFHERARAVAQTLVGDDYEIVFVNDGSTDNSLELAIDLTEHDPQVVVVDLSRNFGHHKAMMVGLEHAKGEHLFLIDSDLEEAPEWLSDFWLALEQEQADVIFGRQKQRKGGWVERWSGDIYYTVFDWLSDIKHPRNVVTARLMTRRYVDALLRYRERETVISGLWVITGFKQSARIVNKLSTSHSSYSLPKKLVHAVNAITSFSAVPLILILYVGLVICFCAMVYAIFLVVLRIFIARPVDGYTSIMVAILALNGLTISLIGVIGIYLAKVFSEVKQRPYTIIRTIYGREHRQH